jgi:hypothetical protein
MDEKTYSIEFTRPELISLMAGGLMSKMLLKQDEPKSEKMKLQHAMLESALDKILPVVVQANNDLKDDDERQAWLNKGEVQQ